jgi:uncharacterized phage protein (TIGR02220 family)
MAGDWIKVEHITPDKPEVYDIAAALKLDPDAVFGKLMRFWVWADQQFIAGKPARIADLAVDSLTRKKGFAAAMRNVGWLGEEGTEAEIPNFDRHNGETAKERAMGNRRVAKSRATNRTNETQEGNLCNGVGVTNLLQKPLPEKRREEKRDSNTTTPNSTTVAVAPEKSLGVGPVWSRLNPDHHIALRESAKRVLSFLNDKTGKAFPATDGSLEPIVCRLAEGASEQQCKTVIARKTRDWKDDPKSEKWLRPLTLFAQDKFPNYLGECVAPTEEAGHA